MQAPVVNQHHPYPLQIRQRIVRMHSDGDGLTYQQISQLMGGRPCADTIGDMCREFKNSGAIVEKRGHLGIIYEGRKFDLAAWELLVVIVEADDQMLYKDIADYMTRRLQVKWSEPDVCKALDEAGFVYNVQATMGRESDPALVAKYGRLYRRRHYHPDQLVFIDEAGLSNRDINKKRAIVPRGQSSKSSSIFLRGRRYSVIMAISTDGRLAHTTFEGTCNKERFTTFIVDLMLNLQPKSVLVMDNAAIHDVAFLTQVCNFNGHDLIFLPPYSPWLNPIEPTWHLYKAFMRHHKDLVAIMDPFDAIDMAIESITKEDCRSIISHVPLYADE